MKLQWILRAKYINTRNWKVFSMKTIFSYFSNMKDDKHNNKIQYIGYLHSCNTVHTFQFLEAYYDLDSIQYSNSIHWNRTQSTTNGNTSTQWHQSKTHELGICRIENKENGLPLLLKGQGHDIFFSFFNVLQCLSKVFLIIIQKISLKKNHKYIEPK